MRVIQITASYKPAYVYGGPTMSVSKLCEELVSFGLEVLVYTTTANGKDELLVDSSRNIDVDGVTVRYFKRLTKDHSHFSPALYWNLWKIAKTYDLIHIHAWWNLVSVFSCIIGISRGIPVLITPRGTLSSYSFHNRTSLPKRIFHSLIGRSLLRRCYFHVTSQKEKADILELFQCERITVIPNFVRLGQPVPLIDTNRVDHNLNLLFLSRIEQKKGLELLFQALAGLQHGWSLSIAGTGEKNYMESLRLLSDQLQITKNISWLGQVGNESKFLTMQRHDLLVLPSFDENFANVVIESLSVGTAVLISEQVGLAEYVEQNNLGWVCKRNVEDLLLKLSEITQSRTQLDEIRKTAVPFIQNEFKESKIVNKYAMLFREIADQ